MLKAYVVAPEAAHQIPCITTAYVDSAIVVNFVCPICLLGVNNHVIFPSEANIAMFFDISVRSIGHERIQLSISHAYSTAGSRANVTPGLIGGRKSPPKRCGRPVAWRSALQSCCGRTRSHGGPSGEPTA